eukprot:tig00000792_g4157.t1
MALCMTGEAMCREARLTASATPLLLLATLQNSGRQADSSLSPRPALNANLHAPAVKTWRVAPVVAPDDFRLPPSSLPVPSSWRTRTTGDGFGSGRRTLSPALLEISRHELQHTVWEAEIADGLSAASIMCSAKDRSIPCSPMWPTFDSRLSSPEPFSPQMQKIQALAERRGSGPSLKSSRRRASDPLAYGNLNAALAPRMGGGARSLSPRAGPGSPGASPPGAPFRSTSPEPRPRSPSPTRLLEAALLNSARLRIHGASAPSPVLSSRPRDGSLLRSLCLSPRRTTTSPRPLDPASVMAQ